MSHSITVTRTTISTTTTVNTRILCTASGLLKLFETIIGGVCLSLVAYYNSSHYGFYAERSAAFLFIVSFAFLMTTFVLLVSFLMSLKTATLLPQTIFEFVYHFLAFVFYMAASLALMTYLVQYDRAYYEGQMAAVILGLVNAALYLLSTIISFRSYRTS